ncbi:MAG: hypothetical protein HND48_15390 [Chloroflexi bacterium]|nr:hypothetical protein [Chloroflexota bacterium]
MQRAGMTWMKVQVRYSPGTGPEAIADVVRTGRDRGFKMLVSAVGSPNDLALGGGIYSGVRQLARRDRFCRAGRDRSLE